MSISHPKRLVRAFVFPGQGAQYVGMGKDLAEKIPAAAAVFERASKRLGFNLAHVCFEGPESDLIRTDIQQPAILTHSIAAVEALRAVKGEAAIQADACAGLSLGEYSALVFAGVLSLEDGVYLVRKRGEFMQEACEAYPSGMAAIGKLERAVVAEICRLAADQTREHCVLGNILSESQITISGGKKAVECAVALAKDRKGRGLVLEVAGAFHSPYMKLAEDKLAAEIARANFQPPRVPVISNVDATPTTDLNVLRANLVKQLTSQVLWSDIQAHLLANGFTRFVEPGPGKVLTGLVKKSAPGAEVLNISTVVELG